MCEGFLRTQKAKSLLLLLLLLLSLSLIYLGFVNFLNPNNDTVNSMSHSFQKGHVGTKSGALLVPPTFVFDDDDTAFFLR